MDDITNEGDKQGVVRYERAKMSGELWFGYLRENGQQTIMVFDHDMPELPDDEVYLFNAKEIRFEIHKKDKIRPQLKPAKNIPTHRLNCIKSDFQAAKRKLEEQTIAWKMGNAPLFGDDFEPFIFSEQNKEQADIAEELRMYTELLDKREQEGWFYPDLDGSILDNIPGPY
ncbi:MAG: hypothetical protein U9P42_08535 [Candidatus Fermentibacteria bacterium]|nr:hypothetical protein [Candidatus Fermentibacteria bacterium]